MSSFVPFTGNEYPTLGVEQEYHLIDPSSGDLVGRMEDVWDLLEGRVAESITHELFYSVLESRSPVARTPAGLLKTIAADRRELADVCRRIGVELVAAGSHPFARWSNQRFVESDHYQWVRRNHGYVAKRLLAFGLHVHVGMRSGEGAVYVMNELRRWAFPLLALSANSPYLEGAVTGLQSSRWHLFRGMPRTGLGPHFKDYAAVEKLYEKLLAAGDITRPGDLWWAIRVQPPLGTVELRLFDLPTDVRRVAALAAVTQATAEHYQRQFEAGRPPTPLRREYLDQNEWRAMRDGLDGTIVDPADGEVLTMGEQVDRLLEMIAPTAEDLGTADDLELARNILRSGSEARRQIDLCDRLDGNLRALELELARRTIASPGD